jgi:ribosome-binding protein aMBF1 (putative translation factor)
MKPLAIRMQEAGMSLDDLVKATGMESKIVKAIASGNYTPSPAQRERLASALGLSIDDIEWGHTVPVEHMYGHGPQFGRSP